MTTRPGVLLCAFCALAAPGLPRPAHAAEAACPFPAVEADAGVLRLAPDLPEQIRSTFARREGVDSCARVTLHSVPGELTAAPEISVQIALRDGRSAARSVARREDVIAVLEALLLLPRSVPPPRAPALRPQSAARLEEAAPAPAPAPSGFGLELSVIAAGGVGAGQTSVGLGVLSLVELWGWLAGFEGRTMSYGSASREPQGTLQLGALGGRRFRSDSLALDVLAGAALASQGQFATETAGPAGTTTETGSFVEPRLLFAGHLSFAQRSTLRGFVGLETEIGLGRGDTEVRRTPEDIAPLPAWMVGVALGATLGTR